MRAEVHRERDQQEIWLQLSTLAFPVRSQCHKTLYSRNLLNKLQCYSATVYDPGKPFQFSLMFAGKARAYPSEAPFRCSTLGYAPGLTYKH
jgi:hypothetical protein